MPYRTELRRPDLKGTFRCSLCNKIFCHSSSLSRHRMQAHFKSYTCTLCNKEITSNETLRAHMYKKHQISRMFMCRCCNWAFPDKTSLHIHMQAMATGSPGNVSIIAKSSSSPLFHGVEDGELDGESPNGMNMVVPPHIVSSGVASPSVVGSIFPSLASRDDMVNRLRERALFSNFVNPAVTGGLDLASLFPNFPKFNPAAAMLALTQQGQQGLDLTNGSVDKNLAKNGHDEDEEMKQSGFCVKNDTDDELDEDGTMADVEYGDSLCGSDDASLDHDRLYMVDASASPGRMISSPPASPSSGGAEATKAKRPASSSPLAIAADSSPPAAKKMRVTTTAGDAVEIDVAGRHPKDTAIPATAKASPSVATPSAINSSPLNSLLYQKKLSNALRNKQRNSVVSDPAVSANNATSSSILNNLIYQKFPSTFFNNAAAAAAEYMSPLLSLHQQLQRQQHQFLGAGVPTSSSSSSSFPNTKEALASNTLAFLPVAAASGQVPKSQATSLTHHQHVLNQLAPSMSDDRHSSTTASHVSPTDTASTKSSGSKPSPSATAQGVGGEDLAAPSVCFQCQVTKGKLAQCENRARFLESRTTSQESKISRLESRVGTLEANSRRYEAEATSLRDHCEALERKILECQERALKYLAGNDFDQETTKRILHDVLETCRVYGAALGHVGHAK